jgi:DNA-binding NtrC family response regulator
MRCLHSTRYTFPVTTKRAHRPHILLAHRDAAWVDQAKQRLEALGYAVTECLEPEWVPDLLGGSRPFDLAAITSEMDPMAQARVLKLVKDRVAGTKIMMLLDQLDSATMVYRANTGIITHRIAADNVHEFALAVAAQVGVPARKPDV